MSFAVDVNILLYASDAASAYHKAARAFVQSCLAGDELFYLAWPTLMGYLRIATHPAVFDHPLSPEEAAQNIESLLAAPHIKVLAEPENFWPAYREVTRRVPTRGNFVPDAHLAALLRTHGVKKLCTHDRDFAKFDFLDLVDPVAGGG